MLQVVHIEQLRSHVAELIAQNHDAQEKLADSATHQALLLCEVDRLVTEKDAARREAEQSQQRASNAELLLDASRQHAGQLQLDLDQATSAQLTAQASAAAQGQRILELQDKVDRVAAEQVDAQEDAVAQRQRILELQATVEHLRRPWWTAMWGPCIERQRRR
jgi:hypothetical protein